MTATHSTAEEAKAEHIRLMGKALGTIYVVLWQEVAWESILGWPKYLPCSTSIDHVIAGRNARRGGRGSSALGAYQTFL